MGMRRRDRIRAWTNFLPCLSRLLMSTRHTNHLIG
jgi:hypothetical protein